ncbi:MAG: protein-export membrane protein SecD [Treponema sp. GWB1_62_6]|nr:MAG: protein-export membrane protein SecD [Treponema sp. GWC1_61_84]OHE68432.1 MAG: protein-export membrane protein SecD [Treponema sp. RIFOXYC1_FULL_61_9]OHE70447.1 MAG: protein-export membrane protein SecD [Treponema sp. GWB1_62_6]HCM27236.1 protein translocase subunit SecD [Treponema sp.]
MSKRYRFFIVLATIAVCFAFLSPTLRWYFMVPKEDQALALGSREQIKTYSTRKAQADLKEIELKARESAEAAVPSNLGFLVATAKANYKLAKLPAPASWSARAVLAAFASENEALEAIESRYRTEVLKLKDLHSSAVQLGLDLSGGMSVVIQANLDSIKEKLGRDLNSDDREDAMNRGLEVLNSRIDRFGLTEPVIRRQGEDQIYVEIPGAADPERINSIIMGKGKLAFHMMDEEATTAFTSYYAANPTNTFDGEGKLLDPTIVPADTVVRGFYEKDRYGLDELSGYMVIKKEVGLDGNHIKNAVVDRDPITGRPEVTFILDAEGGEIFYKLTSANVEKTLTIVMDDKVKSRARIQEAIRDSVRLTGFDADEANNIALVLRTAALPVELEPVNQQAIGASLGEDTIKQGFNALLGGIAAVMVFMLLYYKGAGINAIIAQVLNLYLMLSVLSAFNLTLTLPSIAGFILTIGMAVDANVIVFERIKEELLLGKSRKAAVDAGFDKAFWAIMDSNITTFIAAMFLSQLGTGPIQGFAVSLAIGVMSSVFTALFVSRLIFDFGTDVLGQKKVSISWRIK